MTKACKVVEVRPRNESDGDFMAGVTWVAVDNFGRRFGANTANGAEDIAAAYNRIPPRRPSALPITNEGEQS